MPIAIIRIRIPPNFKKYWNSLSLFIL